MVRLTILLLNQKERSVLKSQYLIFRGNGLKSTGLFGCVPADKGGENISKKNACLKTSPTLFEKGNGHFVFTL